METQEQYRKQEFCKWTIYDDEFWEAECDNVHVFFDGTPQQNGYNFCPYCGKKLSQTEGE
jgi:hypothetical protein